MTCNKLTQLHDIDASRRDAFTGHSRQRHDLIGCSETRTDDAQRVVNASIRMRLFTLEFGSVRVLWTILYLKHIRSLHCAPNKNQYTQLLATTSANTNWFSRSCHWQIRKETFCASVIQIFTSPPLRCYTTLWNSTTKTRSRRQGGRVGECLGGGDMKPANCVSRFYWGTV